MIEKTYLTESNCNGFSFGAGFKQCFHHESSQPKTLPEYALVKDFVQQSDYEKQVILETLKFLYQFTFATRTQIERMLTQKGIDTADLDSLFGKMLDNRYLNLFYLNQFVSEEPAPADAYIIYCMDFGAIAILSHFSSSDSITWFTTDCCRSSELIAKYLSTTEFYLSLAEARGAAVQYFKPIFDVTYKHLNVRFSAAFAVTHGYNTHSFIMESVRSHDLPIEWMDKVDRKITPFSVQDKIWSKYFSNGEPVYLFLVENEQDALSAADIFYRRTGKDNFRMITDGEVAKGFAEADFLRYIPNSDPEKVGTLQKVKAVVLSGNQD